MIQLLDDYNIPYQTEGHKHCRPGWANMKCPFCEGNPGMHLGVNLSTGQWFCWRCGWKPESQALGKLLGIKEEKAKSILKQYSGTSFITKSQNHAIQFKPFKEPSNTDILSKSHNRYLEKRGYDPDEIKRVWGLKGTGPVSFLDHIDFKHRIIAPILWGGEQVSFQARDITERSSLRYITCPENREKKKHKHILYGMQDQWKDVGICVEGITDAWRFGTIAFATFGITFTPQQVRVIAKHFKKVFIVFDDDPQAIEQGKILKSELEFRGLWVHQEIIVGDPGSMDQEDADHLIKQLLKGA